MSTGSFRMRLPVALRILRRRYAGFAGLSRHATTTLPISISHNRRNNVVTANATITRPTPPRFQLSGEKLESNVHKKSRAYQLLGFESLRRLLANCLSAPTGSIRLGQNLSVLVQTPISCSNRASLSC